MISSEKNIVLNQTQKDNLFAEYPWFYANLKKEIEEGIKIFFEKETDVRFIGLTNDDNILFYGDEYFVNKLEINKTANYKIKISKGAVAYFLDNALGNETRNFELNYLTGIEADLIKSFSAYIYKRLETSIDKVETKTSKLSKEYCFTFFIKECNKHIGKIIISLPDYVLPERSNIVRKSSFTAEDFIKANTFVKIKVGKSKIELNDIKALEEGDIIVLELSNINTMSVETNGGEIPFKINPNPALIMNIDNNGGNEMEEGTGNNSQNMWDSILVDIVAEFDNVKMTLGELKEISEGLVIDVGNVYENKINLRVENKVVATGELVIINDRYGVRIDEIKQKKKQPLPEAKKLAAQPAGAKPAPQAKANPHPVSQKPAENKPAQAKAPAPQAKEGDKNFDYSDFEIEDESI